MNFDPHRPARHNLPIAHGEFYGWRVWRLFKHGQLFRLMSVNSVGREGGSTWAPRKMLEAVCPSHPNDPNHHVPSEGCTCGFYTAVSREHLASLSYGEMPNELDIRVYGKVAIAGKVIPGSQGWRSQYAWPVELWVPTFKPEFVAPLARQYSIPVHLGNLNYTRKGVAI